MKGNGKIWFLVLFLIVFMAGCGGTDTNTTPTTPTDTTAPTNTTQADFINSGATSTNSTAVTLAISATDNVGVTGYYLSESSTTPSSSATGWVSVTSQTSYSASVSFTLSSGDGTKTVFVWFMDAAGNVSGSASDSITLSIVVGSTFPIATTTGGELSISAAFDGTNYLVGIEGDINDFSSITAQLIDQSGNLVGSRINTGRTGGAPFVAFDGTNYLMVWADSATFPNKTLFGQRIGKTGNPLGSPFQIDPGPLGNNEIDGIAFGGGTYLVVYYKDVDPCPCPPGTDNSKVYGRLISPDGTVGGEIVISTGFGDFGANGVAFDGNNFLVVWTDDANDTEVKGRFVSPTGTLGTEFTINASTSPSDNPLTVVFDGTNYLVVWTDEVGGFGSGEWDIFGQIVDKSGNPVGNAISISTAPGEQFFPNIAFDGTNYLITWTDMRNDTNKNGVCDPGEGTCWDIYGQYISTLGTRVSSEFPINTDAGNQFGSPVVFAGGKYLAIVTTGLTVDPPGCTEVCGFVGGDVYGQFITPTDTSNTGTVTGTVTYTGSLGPVSASKPILVMLDPFPNEFGNLAINGTFEQIATLTTSPGTFTFTNVPAGQYHLVVLLDVNNDGVTDDVNNGNPVRTDGDPVEVYTPGNETGSNCNTDPATAFTVTAGQTYSLSPSITFNDTMWAGGPGVTLSGQPCQ